MVSKRKLNNDDKNMTVSKRTKILPGKNAGPVDNENIPRNMQNSDSLKSDSGCQLSSDKQDASNTTQNKTSKKRLNLRKPTQTTVIKNNQADLPKKTFKLFKNDSNEEGILEARLDTKDNIFEKDHLQGCHSSSSSLQACPICKRDISTLKSDSERNEHINNCLDSNNTDLGINEPLSPRAATLGKTSNHFEFCQLCSRDISKYNTVQKQQHLNRCCDNEEETSNEKTKDDIVYKCVICDKTFKTVKAKNTHLKKCAKKNNVGTATLVNLNKDGGIAINQESINLLATPKSADVFVTAKKKKKKIYSANVKELDEGTQLALALSASMQVENKTAKTKHSKKKNSNNLPALLLRSENEAKRITEARAAEVLCQWGDSDEEIQATPALAPSNLQNKYHNGEENNNKSNDVNGDLSENTEENNTKKNYLKIDVKARLWHAASLDPNSYIENNFYVPNLLPDTDRKDAAVSPTELTGFEGDKEYMENINESPKESDEVLSEKEDQIATAKPDDVMNDNRPSLDVTCRDNLEITWLPPSGFCVDEKNATEKEQTTENEDAQSLISALSSMIGEPFLSDVDIIAKNQQVFPAHSFMLAARCSRLKKMITDEKSCEANVNKNGKIILKMEDIDIQAIHAIVTFLYTAAYTPVSSNIVNDLKKLIKRLDISCNLNGWLDVKDASILTEDPIKDVDKEENLDVLLESLWEDDYKNTEDVDDTFGDGILVDERFTVEMYSQRNSEKETQVQCSDENPDQFMSGQDRDKMKEFTNRELGKKSQDVENKQLSISHAPSPCQTKCSLPDDTINVKDEEWLKDTSGWLIPETPLKTISTENTSVTITEKVSAKIVCDLTSTKEDEISANNQDSKSSPDGHDISNKDDLTPCPTPTLVEDSSSNDAVICMDVDSPNSSSTFEDVVLSPTCPSLSYFTPNCCSKDESERDGNARSDWEETSLLNINHGDDKMFDWNYSQVTDSQVKYHDVGHRNNRKNSINMSVDNDDNNPKEWHVSPELSENSRKRTEKFQIRTSDQGHEFGDQDIDWYDDQNFDDTANTIPLNSTARISDNNKGNVIPRYVERGNIPGPRCAKLSYIDVSNTGGNERNSVTQHSDSRDDDYRLNDNRSGDSRNGIDPNHSSLNSESRNSPSGMENENDDSWNGKDIRKDDNSNINSGKNDIPKNDSPKYDSPENEIKKTENRRHNRKSRGKIDSVHNSSRNISCYISEDGKSGDDVLVEENRNNATVSNYDEIQGDDYFDCEIACYDDGGFNCDIDDNNFNLYQTQDHERVKDLQDCDSLELDCNDDIDPEGNGTKCNTQNIDGHDDSRNGAKYYNAKRESRNNNNGSNGDGSNYCSRDEFQDDDENDPAEVNMVDIDHEVQDGGYSDSEIACYDDGGFNCDIDDYFVLQMSPKADDPDDDISSTCVMKTPAKKQVPKDNVPEPSKPKSIKDNTSKTGSGISKKAGGKQSKKTEVQKKPRLPGTPMLDYSNMATPDLQNNIKRYGVRPLPKKKMIIKLKEIYHYTHKDTSSDSEHDDEVTVSHTEEVNCQPNSEECDFDDDGIEENPYSCENNQYNDEEESDDRELLSQESLQDLSRDFMRFLEQDHDAYIKILKYEPVPLSFFQERLKQSGVNYSAEKLKNFLDEQCVTYTERKGSRTRKKQRKPRSQSTK